jgi:ubiquinone/menaquinone biosynthesis C-methylase UbiE
MVVDYSIIAKTYDYAPFRSIEKVDNNLLKFATSHHHVRVLDIACGTGNYIKTQSTFIKNATFIGMDISCAMLTHARRKGITSLILADVDRGIPLEDSCVDYVVCRYGFHHFKNKSFVLKEIRRCLQTYGILSMIDVDPHTNKMWWVYALFPEVVDSDRQRFWKVEDIVLHLKYLGYEVSYYIDTGPEIMHKQDLLERLRNRDTSQLHMIDQQLYEKKLRDVEKWPEDKCINGDYAFLSINGKKMH